MVRISLVAVSWIMLLLCVAQADCLSWIMPGDFIMVQTNGYRPAFSLEQKYGQLSGSAIYFDQNTGQPINGSVLGHIYGQHFEVTVDWPTHPATSGVYSGTFDANGHLTGRTYDQFHPDSTADWYIDQPAVCVSQGGPSTQGVPPGLPSTQIVPIVPHGGPGPSKKLVPHGGNRFE
jgi:hypothetical protein